MNTIPKRLMTPGCALEPLFALSNTTPGVVHQLRRGPAGWECSCPGYRFSKRPKECHHVTAMRAGHPGAVGMCGQPLTFTKPREGYGFAHTVNCPLGLNLNAAQCRCPRPQPRRVRQLPAVPLRGQTSMTTTECKVEPAGHCWCKSNDGGVCCFCEMKFTRLRQ